MKRLIAGAVFLLAVALPGKAEVIHVPDQYPTINAAVQAANSGDVVLVDPGTYGDVTHQPPDDTTYCAVLMKTGVTVQGSGQGVTIVDADSVGRAFHCEGVTNVTIRDLTIRRCFAEHFGAAVLATEFADITVINLVIENGGDGGIIAVDTSSVVASNCIVRNNAAKVGGGVEIGDLSNLEMYECEVTGNQAPDGGGMIIRGGSTAILDHCTISGNHINSDNGSGGGLTIRNVSQVTITNSIIENNTADGSGGGLAIIDECDVSMTECLVKGNRTLADYAPGGGIYCDISGLELDDCTIVRNVVNGAESDGGGIYAFFADPMSVHQCTIAANENLGLYLFGGGISVNYTSPIIEKTIIAFNDPDGIYCTEEFDDPVVSCTDIYGNTGSNAICGIDLEHNFSLDPLFCDIDNDNYRLQMSSPCYPGNHPDGASACQNQRIGSEDPGCDPNAVDDPAVTARANRLLANRPNPFHPSTTISFELAGPGHTVLRVFDVAGREITTLVDRPLTAGRHQSLWNGRNDDGTAVPSGVYFYQLNVDGAKQTRNMVLSR